jgi:hypothetical protein
VQDTRGDFASVSFQGDYQVILFAELDEGLLVGAAE